MLDARMCMLPGRLIGAAGTAQLVRGNNKCELRLSLKVESTVAQAVVLETKHHRDGQIFTLCAIGVLIIAPVTLATVSEHLSLYDQHRMVQAEE